MKIQILVFSIIVLASTYLRQNYQVQLDQELKQDGFRQQDIIEFDIYENEFNKQYENIFTRKYRLEVYLKNKKEIERHNQNDHELKWGINRYTDLENVELSEYFMHIELDKEPELNEDDDIAYAPIPHFNPFLIQSRLKAKKSDGIDWRWSGVTQPQLQGRCGSCWAFSSADVIIGRLAIAGKEKIQQMSKQQLLDCSRNNCYGCKGGWPQDAMKYVKKNGLLPEDQYNKYSGKQEKCNQAKEDKAKIGKKTYKIYKKKDPSIEQIQETLEAGPVVVIMLAYEDWFKYQKGVLDPCVKDGKGYLHAMSIIGSTDKQWIVKNSWGPDWGEGGFMRIPKLNSCEAVKGIMAPIVK